MWEFPFHEYNMNTDIGNEDEITVKSDAAIDLTLYILQNRPYPGLKFTCTVYTKHKYTSNASISQITQLNIIYIYIHIYILIMLSFLLKDSFVSSHLAHASPAARNRVLYNWICINMYIY